ncbi:MAG: decarboxylase [Firmicutes bacterium HGW-Firmicutes-15]|nr:MAG: decarboxylase [Firmicutes bacterium HGW-Firmicutes-15]
MPYQTPIYTALKKYMKENNLRLHVPGHIGGKGMPAPELEALACMDITEIPGLDDLHLAQGIIEEAQQLLARACGARESLFLLNGATSGVHALFMSIGDGERVMIPRNAHRSFYGGMVLSGAMPVYIPCEIEPELGIALAVKAADVEDLLHLNNNVGAVFVASPSYYGTCSDIAGIATVVRRWGKMLFVDEAHGAHFPFHPMYPNCALKDGANAVVNGLHKTWPVLTQGACLHLGEDFNNHARLMVAYSLITTTSPSYPIMASIDLARDFMEKEGTSYLERSLELSREFKSRMDKIQGIRCYGDELMQISGVKALDPLKVLIGVQGLSLNGYQVARVLREEHHIQVEMEDQNLILAMFSFLHKREDWERFYLTLNELALRYPSQGVDRSPGYQLPLPRIILSPRQAFFAASKRVKLAECRGRVAGEMVAAYPPGIPCLAPGELITEEVWDYLNYLKMSEARIQGPEVPNLEYINVIEE